MIITAFRDRLRELGYLQAQNLVIEARARDRYDRLAALVNEVIERICSRRGPAWAAADSTKGLGTLRGLLGHSPGAGMQSVTNLAKESYL